MTRVKMEIGKRNVLIIEAEPPGKCELCGAIEETRPYGFDGTEVCFKCANSTPEALAEAKRRFGALIDGAMELE